MSTRGTKAMHEAAWQTDQRRDGRADARAGRPGRCSDQFYQRGYREGLARPRRDTMATRTFTIKSSDLAACPGHVLLPRHYRPDGSCLHNLREREPVIYVSDERDDGPREYYSGSKAVIIRALDEGAGLRYLLEFDSGTHLEAAASEVTPAD